MASPAHQTRCYTRFLTFQMFSAGQRRAHADGAKSEYVVVPPSGARSSIRSSTSNSFWRNRRIQARREAGNRPDRCPRSREDQNSPPAILLKFYQPGRPNRCRVSGWIYKMRTGHPALAHEMPRESCRPVVRTLLLHDRRKRHRTIRPETEGIRRRHVRGLPSNRSSGTRCVHDRVVVLLDLIHMGNRFMQRERKDLAGT